MFPQATWAQIESVCGDFAVQSTECLALMAEVDLQIGAFNIYNVVCPACACIDRVTSWAIVAV